jgi:hypothetical protein
MILRGWPSMRFGTTTRILVKKRGTPAETAEPMDDDYVIL